MNWAVKCAFEESNQEDWDALSSMLNQWDIKYDNMITSGVIIWMICMKLEEFVWS